MGKYLLDLSIVLSVLTGAGAIVKGLWRISNQLHEMRSLILTVPGLTIAIKELTGRVDKLENGSGHG